MYDTAFDADVVLFFILYFANATLRTLLVDQKSPPLLMVTFYIGKRGDRTVRCLRLPMCLSMAKQ